MWAPNSCFSPVRTCFPVLHLSQAISFFHFWYQCPPWTDPSPKVWRFPCSSEEFLKHLTLDWHRSEGWRVEQRAERKEVAQKAKMWRKRDKMGLFWLSVSFYNLLLCASSHSMSSISVCITFILSAISIFPLQFTILFIAIKHCAKEFMVLFTRCILCIVFYCVRPLSLCFLLVFCPFTLQSLSWNMHATKSISTNLRTGKIISFSFPCFSCAFLD